MGATKRISAVRWGVTLQIVRVWLFTIPGAGLMGAAYCFLVKLFLKG